MIFEFIKKLVKYYIDKLIHWMRMTKFNLELDNEIKKYHEELDKKVNALQKTINEHLTRERQMAKALKNMDQLEK